MSNFFDNPPETEPKTLLIGDLWTWKRTDLGTDYPNDSYTLSYELRLEGTGATSISITASASGDDYLVSVASATTAGYTAGTYRWDAYITRDSDSERYRVDFGSFEIKPDRSASSADPRSHSKIMLDKIESLLEGRADADVEEYSIGGRSLTKLPLKDLLMWRDRYRAEWLREVRQERIRNGQPTGNTIKVRF